MGGFPKPLVHAISTAAYQMNTSSTGDKAGVVYLNSEGKLVVPGEMGSSLIMAIVMTYLTTD